jgi:DNA-directed RNA polymerase subunit H (RpoH/RPB5)
MPSAWRVNAVDERLRREGLNASVTERDLYSLVDAERHAVLGAMVVRQAELPMVVVNDVVACFGDIDLDVIVRVSREVTKGGGCGC